MDHVTAEDWVRRYEELWRTPGTDRLGELFAPGATYLPSPWADPFGLPERREVGHRLGPG